ncbi:hypothetical protein RclHR1_15300002 [Rhizophagus clarus]|uniref:Uncharacterized protein n=1 Tax=Rhizophagus clarus TaxID=94130 RepID=A0A2Z6QS95_9GLOM|nr:hypothetical protein RclHR1_15300002 [Rhizophagus clarus]
MVFNIGLEHRTYGLGLYFEGPELQFETDQSLNFISRGPTVRNSILRQTNSSPKLHFKADHCLKLHFETDHCPDVPFRRLDSIRRSRVTIFEGHLKVQTKPGLFKGLERSISKAGLYLKSRAQADQNISKVRASWMPYWIEVKSCLLESSSGLWNCRRMSEQNLFVSAFQADFLLKILAGLHILKVQNSNSKRTEVLNFILRRTTVQNSIPRQTTKSRTSFRDGPLSGTSFRGGPLNLKLHFEADHCPEFRDRPVFRSYC